MGKGDRKTRKGKIYRGSYGNVRPHSPKSKAAVKAAGAPKSAAPAKPAARPAAKKAAPKKAATKKSA